MRKIGPDSSLLYIAVLICLLAAGLFMFSQSDYFHVREVRVEGLKNIAQEEILRLLGTVKGENIFLTDTAALSRKIKIHPLVEEAAVEKKLPATLVLKIQERRPLALILNSDNLVEVDSEGTILKFYETWPQNDSPVLTGITIPETTGPGQKLSSPQLAKELLLLREAPQGLSSLIGEINIAPDGQIVVFLTSGIRVKFGYDEDYTAKLKLLEELIASQEYKAVEKAIKYIDLTAGKPVLGR